MSPPPVSAVYGQPLPELALAPPGAVQVSPLVPGSAALDEIPPGSVEAMVVAAPPGTIERRYVLALALRALRPGGALTALAPKEKGGSRIGKELAAFGCEVHETPKRKQRICETTRPETLAGLDTAIEAGRPRIAESLGLWTQPGVFSWDRPDPGSVLLIRALPKLTGRGADLGAGVGLLSRAVLTSPDVTELALVELDRRAHECSRRNVLDARASFHWQDARTGPELSGLDFMVMNPPFHDGGAEDKSLGQAFIRRGHAILRKGGSLWIVANRHLPYEGVLAELFASVALRAEGGGFKVYEARK
ncbi:class I SAM-dependent methyltransferase [Phenylobacterium sp. J426]|uniref:class I SAM-dependent methyltransferase n=1 Tax=Phenylobacterium sp. J426 TaxID=2898439 RepID=UPI0021508A9E|nr:class I SAM-dependent methyltransferase [Phenylobacterium sp. J426]MCR5876361.1 class I SAM-dependent methyltransferase [Phenylobacterium sp. J426]